MTKAKLTSATVKIVELERLNNSYNGNPRWAVTWETIGLGTITKTDKTAPDASVGYEIGNKGLRVDDRVTITVDGRGRIIYMVPA